MRIKWATLVWNWVLYPYIRFHERYWTYKTLLDRWLEKNAWYTNVFLGASFGLTSYFIVHPLLPGRLEASNGQLREESREILSILHCDAEKEFPHATLLNFRRDILSAVQLNNDRALLKESREEIEKLKARLAEEEQQLLALGLGGDSVPEAVEAQSDAAENDTVVE